MSSADLFQRLGAPLKNPRWSWGAVSGQGTVFLRVWADEFQKLNGKQTVRVTKHKRFEDEPDNLGYKERVEHIALIGAGAPSFCVLCKAKDPSTKPREVASYDDKTVFVGGELIDHEGDSWLELTDRISIDEVR